MVHGDAMAEQRRLLQMMGSAERALFEGVPVETAARLATLARDLERSSNAIVPYLRARVERLNDEVAQLISRHPRRSRLTSSAPFVMGAGLFSLALPRRDGPSGMHFRFPANVSSRAACIGGRVQPRRDTVIGRQAFGRSGVGGLARNALQIAGLVQSIGCR